MVCLLKDLYKQELSEYKKIMGSTAAAYYVLAMNNGYTLDQTPLGEHSLLYDALLAKNEGDEKKTILEKCMIFAPSFISRLGNFTEGLYTGTLDDNGEPSIQDINGGPLCDSSAVKAIFKDAGTLMEDAIKRLDMLEKKNILVRDYTISDIIDQTRSVWVSSSLTAYFDRNPNASMLDVAREKSNLEVQWDNETRQRLLGDRQRQLAERFGLTLHTDPDGNTYYTTDEKSKRAKLRVLFVNSLRSDSWRDENGLYHKGMYVEGNDDAAVNLIYISLLDGDASTIIHELAHHYVRTFWESDLIQDALRTFDSDELVRRYKKNPVILEEQLVKAITDKVLFNDSKSWVSKFWGKFNKLVKDTLGLDMGGYNARQNLIDNITMCFTINQNLSDNKTRQAIYDKWENEAFLGVYTNTEVKNNMYNTMLQSLRRRKDSLKAKILKDNPAISKLEHDIERLKKVDPQNYNEIVDEVESLLGEAEKELTAILNELCTYDLNESLLDLLNARRLLEMKTDVIEYYAKIFNNNEIAYFKRLPELLNNKAFSDAIDSIRSKIQSSTEIFNIVSEKYVTRKIDEYVDELVDVGDRERVRTNMHLWLRSLINNGSLMMFENWMGIASQSRSPIVRLIEYIVQAENNKVRRQTLPVGNHLKTLYDKAAKDDSFTTFRNFMKRFVELDEDGQPTGYWLRKKNYGLFFKDKDELESQLLKDYEGSVIIDADGLYIFDTEENRKEFLDKKDVKLDRISNRQYTAEYYIKRREMLSDETLEKLGEIRTLINILIQKCTDISTGIPEIHKLTQEERDQLNNLYRDQNNLGNIYDIKYNAQGYIVSFGKKTGKDLKIAEEIQSWKAWCKDKVKYLHNQQKFDQDRLKLVEKYGENSDAVIWFDWYYSSRQISSRFYKLKTQRYGSTTLPEELIKLYQRRSLIIDSVRDRKGFYMPHLERLNDAAWKELRDIEDEINRRKATLNLASREDLQDEESISTQEYVKLYLNGKFTDKAYYFYVKDLYSELLFYEKFYVNVYDENGEVVKQKPLSVFWYEKPLDELLDSEGSFNPVEQLPTGRYSELVKDFGLANPNYDTSDSALIQPNDKYKSDRYNELYAKDSNGRYIHQEQIDFYEALLKTMQQANEWIPNYIDTRSFRMPGMTERTSHLIFRQKGNPFKNIWKHFSTKLSTVSDRDTDFNEELARKPNGDLVYTIPLRWISKLEDPTATSLDILGSVMSYYEMAYNYHLKQQIAPVTELILSQIQGGITPTGKNSTENAQTERIKKYIEMYVYGRMRAGLSTDKTIKMTNTQKRIATALDYIAEKSYLKMMAHNFRGIIKNFIDAGMTSIVEMAAGKYFEKDDMIYATLMCSREFFNTIQSINTPNNKSWVSGAMQYNGVSGRIIDLFSRQNETALRRFVERFGAMGEYTFVDYTVKGWVIPAIYHNHRLVQNFEYRKVTLDDGQEGYISEKQAKILNKQSQWEASTDYRMEYMNKELAQWSYVRGGRTKQEGLAAWKKSKQTLCDAYGLNEEGTFMLKQEYVDLVRPYNYVTGKRSFKTEDRVTGVIRDRFAVIAGMLPEENRGAMMQTYVGTFVFMLRGWLITFAWDCLRSGSDYATHVFEEDEEGNRKSDQSINKIEDLDFIGEMFEFNTAHSGKGWLRQQPRLWGRLFMRGINKVIKTLTGNEKHLRHVTPNNETQRQQIAKMSYYVLMLLITILGSHIFGRLLEDDPDSLTWNFGYSASIALIPERATQLIPTAILDLIKNASAALSYIDDINNTLTIPLDTYYTLKDAYLWAIDDPEFMEDQDKIVKTGTYMHMTKSSRDFLKGSSILFPELGLNNMAKNLRPEGHWAYQNWQLQQAPVQMLQKMGVVYKPDRSKNSKRKTSTKRSKKKTRRIFGK